jgi:hypothetical protein
MWVIISKKNLIPTLYVLKKQNAHKSVRYVFNYWPNFILSIIKENHK